MRVVKSGLVLWLLLAAWPLAAEEVLVAVASNFRAPMQDIAAQFEAASGHSVKLSYGSSGIIFAQISNGAPYDIFLSADQQSPQRLQTEGRVQQRLTYALGRLVLWTAEEGSADPQQRLRDGDYNKLALANPRLAPYGLAAVDSLNSLKLLSASRAHWVLGENIAQAYQFVQTGNAELGFVALSQVIDPQQGAIARGSGWLVPQHLHTPIRQDAALLDTAAGNVAAEALWRYLQSQQVKDLIQAYGYATLDSELPDTD